MAVSDHGSPADAPPGPPDPGDSSEPDIRRSGIVLLAIALVVAIGFVVLRDRLPYPLQPPPGPAAAAGATVRTATPSAPAASVAPSLAPSPPPPSADPTIAPTPRPTATPQPTPVSDRFAVLRPCPGTAGCWIYRVRSGDNLYSIANWFGVPLARVYQMNPWLRTTGLRAGQELRLPRPTR